MHLSIHAYKQQIMHNEVKKLFENITLNHIYEPFQLVNLLHGDITDKALKIY